MSVIDKERAVILREVKPRVRARIKELWLNRESIASAQEIVVQFIIDPEP